MRLRYWKNILNHFTYSSSSASHRPASVQTYQHARYLQQIWENCRLGEQESLSSVKMVEFVVWQKRDPPKYSRIFAKDIRRSTYLPYYKGTLVNIVI